MQSGLFCQGLLIKKVSLISERELSSRNTIWPEIGLVLRLDSIENRSFAVNIGEAGNRNIHDFGILNNNTKIMNMVEDFKIIL